MVSSPRSDAAERIAALRRVLCGKTLHFEYMFIVVFVLWNIKRHPDIFIPNRKDYIMSVNIGNVDRALRALLGLALLAAALGGIVPALAIGAPKWIAVVVGATLLATAGLRICPLYTLLGIRTCQR
jgi:hypothetical protein